MTEMAEYPYMFLLSEIIITDSHLDSHGSGVPLEDINAIELARSLTEEAFIDLWHFGGDLDTLSRGVA